MGLLGWDFEISQVGPAGQLLVTFREAFEDQVIEETAPGGFKGHTRQDT